MLKVLLEACSYPEILKIWGKKTHTYRVGGERARDIELITTVKQAALEQDYRIIGGKTGMWTCDGYDQHNLVMVAEHRVTHKAFAGVILGADSADGRFSAMHELFDIASERAEGIASARSVTHAVSAIVCELPKYTTAMYQCAPIDILYEQEADREHVPASVNKVVSLITALDYLPTIKDTVELEAKDVKGGSGAVHYEGDLLSVEEMIYSMLLPSSNTCATALASLVGGIILKKNAEKTQRAFALNI